MRLQHPLPMPLALMAAGWACATALAHLHLRALRPAQPASGSEAKTSRPKPSARAGDDNVTRLTPEDEVLLLHLLE